MSGQEGVPAWSVLETERLLNCPPWLEVVRERLVVPGGTKADFFRVEMPAFAQVLPVTPDGDLVLIEAYRPGYREWSWGVPGGMVEPGESPEKAAARELLEETGYKANRFLPAGNFGIDGNRGCGRMHLFLGLGAERVSEAKLDATEQMRVRVVGVDEAKGRLLAGDFKGLPEMGSLALGLLVLEGFNHGL